mgnify:CR=1 FL=1
MFGRDRRGILVGEGTPVSLKKSSYTHIQVVVGWGQPLDIGFIVLVDDEGPIAVEFLDASHGVDLIDIPHASDISEGLAGLQSLVLRDAIAGRDVLAAKHRNAKRPEVPRRDGAVVHDWRQPARFDGTTFELRLPD